MADTDLQKALSLSCQEHITSDDSTRFADVMGARDAELEAFLRLSCQEVFGSTENDAECKGSKLKQTIGLNTKEMSKETVKFVFKEKGQWQQCRSIRFD